MNIGVCREACRSRKSPSIPPLQLNLPRAPVGKQGRSTVCHTPRPCIVSEAGLNCQPRLLCFIMSAGGIWMAFFGSYHCSGGHMTGNMRLKHRYLDYPAICGRLTPNELPPPFSSLPRIMSTVSAFCLQPGATRARTCGRLDDSG